MKVAYLITVLLLTLPAVADCETSAVLAISQQHPSPTEASPHPASSRRQKFFVVSDVQEADAQRVAVPSAREVQEGSEYEAFRPLFRRAVFAILLSSFLGLALFVCVRRSRPDALHRKTTDLELISTLALAPRCCLSLVRVQERSVLVARDASGVKEMLVLPGDFSDYFSDDETSATPTNSGQFAGVEV